MSGGFFRGTSADQDTRFSNKQAKLLKTQKFAPELDHLVDTSKVKMDVMKPWIAKRVTELLGFEDEVLINFIYGLLEEKVSNLIEFGSSKSTDGKKIQIQLTGFMEKNTVKFMRELWTLLLSAQQNASGVPQQFLDEKEAEIQQKKAEDDRIAQEIQKKREMEENDSELVKNKVMDGDAGNSRSYGDPVGSALNSTNFNTEEEKNNDFKRSLRAKNR
ncbi:PWI domain-containing protein C825.05c [Zea mays]|uniref:PWI domain-containing protein C825.05c n=1 Tax=Zea mays TaxID=4577 RepID=A0A317Y9C0_MAIZE|nr:PWI domain-containing protein C825.05c [Zea mays]